MQNYEDRQNQKKINNIYIRQTECKALGERLFKSKQKGLYILIGPLICGKYMFLNQFKSINQDKLNFLTIQFKAHDYDKESIWLLIKRSVLDFTEQLTAKYTELNYSGFTTKVQEICENTYDYISDFLNDFIALYSTDQVKSIINIDLLIILSKVNKLQRYTKCDEIQQLIEDLYIWCIQQSGVKNNCNIIFSTCNPLFPEYLDQILGEGRYSNQIYKNILSIGELPEDQIKMFLIKQHNITARYADELYKIFGGIYSYQIECIKQAGVMDVDYEYLQSFKQKKITDLMQYIETNQKSKLTGKQQKILEDLYIDFIETEQIPKDILDEKYGSYNVNEILKFHKLYMRRPEYISDIEANNNLINLDKIVVCAHSKFYLDCIRDYTRKWLTHKIKFTKNL